MSSSRDAKEGRINCAGLSLRGMVRFSSTIASFRQTVMGHCETLERRNRRLHSYDILRYLSTCRWRGMWQYIYFPLHCDRSLEKRHTKHGVWKRKAEKESTTRNSVGFCFRMELNTVAIAGPAIRCILSFSLAKGQRVVELLTFDIITYTCA